MFVGYWSLWTCGAFVFFMLCRFPWSEELDSMLIILDAKLLLPLLRSPKDALPTPPGVTSPTPPREAVRAGVRTQLCISGITVCSRLCTVTLCFVEYVVLTLWLDSIL